MAKGKARTRWRRLLVLLIVTSGVVLAWVSSRRRAAPAELAAWAPAPPIAPAHAPAAVETATAAPVAAEPVVPEPPRMTEPAVAEPVAAEPVVSEPPPVTESVVAEPVVTEPMLAEPMLAEPARPAEEPAPAVEPAHLFASGAEPTSGPYPGSVLPRDDGSAPSEEFVIKGNAGSMLSHSPSSPYYRRTRAEVWFRTEQDAAAAGFRPWTPKK